MKLSLKFRSLDIFRIFFGILLEMEILSVYIGFKYGVSF